MNKIITHSVFFKLKHASGSEEEKEFLNTSLNVLSTIGGVKNFRVLTETSPKNDFTLGFTMEFNDQAAYDGYSNHKDHMNYVQNLWIPQVECFQEIDFIEKM